MPNPLTHETFAEFVRAHRFVVIHFWAAWNAVDHVMKKLLETEIPPDVREQIVFASLDIDPPLHHPIARDLKVSNVPFLAFYRDGLLARTVAGMRTPDVLTHYLRELVK